MIELFNAETDWSRAGEEMYQLIAELYPICRSITGNGVRETLSAFKRLLPLEIHEIPSGTPIFDWTVPNEWNIRDAYVANRHGERVIDFKQCNLHVLNYSAPFRGRMPLSELRTHLFSLPDKPDWIPYRTSYYKENWGFCVSQKQLDAMPDEEYEVVIDSSLEPGALTYGEYFLRGRSDQEVLISCHVCHPSLCNDNLSGNSLAIWLARNLAATPNLGYSYRFLFIPGTIGSIAWLSRNEEAASRIRHGLVVVCVGDSGRFSYKKSRRGDAPIDRAVEHVLKNEQGDYNLIEFYPYGYDERQYCSPGFNLGVGSLSRSTHGKFPEYHTSADNLDFVSPKNLAESLEITTKIIDLLENDRIYLNQNPKCEPQLGKRGLYSNVGAATHRPFDEMALLWVLNLCDGEHSLLDIAERAGMKFDAIKRAAEALLNCGLLKPADI